MTVRAHPPTTAVAGTITVFTVPVSCVISGQTQPQIQPTSYWDLPSQTVFLDVAFPFVIPTGSPFSVYQDKASNAPLSVNKVAYKGKIATLTVTGVFKLTTGLWPNAILAQASLGGSAWTPTSQLWKFPAAAAGGIRAPKPVVNFNPTALNVSWDRIYNASSTAVSVTAPNSTTPVTKSVTYPTSAVTFLPTDSS